MNDGWAQTRFHTATPRLLSRQSGLPRLPQLPRLLWIAILLALVVLLGLIGWLWFRDSSFVRIERVTVSGVSGPNAGQIRSTLRRTALNMTTLDLNVGRLDAAVGSYPQVRSLAVTTSGRHSVTIAVVERVPVAAVRTGGRAVVVDADGLLLRHATASPTELPTLSLATAPDGQRIMSLAGRAQVAVLAAAPTKLLAHVLGAAYSSAHGVILQLRAGPQVDFGSDAQLAAKWDALVAVLQSSTSAGAAYIDVTDPEHPAAGVTVGQTGLVTGTTAPMSEVQAPSSTGGAASTSGASTPGQAPAPSSTGGVSTAGQTQSSGSTGGA